MKSNLKSFTRITIITIIVIAAHVIAACGEESSDEAPTDNASILGGNAAIYTKAIEIDNGTEANSEETANTLKTGQRITSSLKANSSPHATSFTDIEAWQPQKSYYRGDVVRVNYDIYISIIPSKGLIPGSQARHWDIIDYNNRSEFQTKTLYRIGDVVSHEDRFYISRGMNNTVNPLRFNDERRWIEFTHPGLFYDLPPAPDDPDASLFGIDANHNGIRDDYELATIFSDLPQPVKDSALSAGKAYGALTIVALEDGDIDRDRALKILHNLVLAKACRTRMRELHQGVAWQESTYFNTMDRIEAKFKLQNMLANLLEPEGYNLPREQEPCVALAAK
ncbi:MAG: hypothetical protein IBX47_01410 [Desulfuromonadales bacterium]|nr:hypothetical protein [Desulfuromonadales bacterium]